MFSRLAHASGRLLILALLVGPLYSFARLPDLPWSFAILIASLAALTAWRPFDGLLAVCAFVPIARLVALYAGAGSFRAAEIAALAALAGWFARTAFDRGWPVPAAVRRPAAWFGAIVTASMLAQLAVLQVQRDYPGPFIRSFFAWLTAAYAVDPASFRSVHEAALLLEGLGLLAASAAACRRQGTGAPLRHMLVVGATAAGALNLVRLATSALRTESPLQSLWATLQWVRLNEHFGDVNAAGSQFLLVLLVALGLAAASRGGARAGWSGCAVVLAAALWLTGSHAAYAGFALAALCGFMPAILASRWGRGARGPVLLPIAAGLVLIVVVAAGVVAWSDEDVRRALRIRRDLTEVAVGMVQSSPVFGIGIGRFYPESGRHFSPLLHSLYVSENAHNNFLQILAELGVAGLAAFCWLLWSVLAPAARQFTLLPAGARGALAGLLGLLLTAFAGHPLLIHEVAFTFWFAMAAAAADSGVAADHPEPRRNRTVAAALIGALAVSVVLQAHRGRSDADLEHVTHGLGGWQVNADGQRFRTARGEATFFVHRSRHDTFRLELPLHVDGRPAPFWIEVDGRRTVAFQLQPGAWRTVALHIPPGRLSNARVTVRTAGEFKAGVTRYTRVGPLWRWGDVDGDRRADMTVYRSAAREWVSLTSSSGFRSATRIAFGSTGGLPLGRDFDGDAMLDPAIFVRSSAEWHVALSGSAYAGPQRTVWGMPGDLPVPADYDGDDRTDYAVFRPTDGTWAARLSSDGSTLTAAWGRPTDIPVPADYDGDGTDDIAVYRPRTGVWLVRDRWGAALMDQIWGKPGDKPAPADYDGDFRADLAVFRPAEGRWYVRSSREGTYQATDWGLAGDVPMPADYDGDGKADLAVYRPSATMWLVRGGLVGDLGAAPGTPVPRRAFEADDMETPR